MSGNFKNGIMPMYMTVELVRGLFRREGKLPLIVSSNIEGGPIYEVTNPQELRKKPINTVDPREFKKLGITLLSLRDIAKQLGCDRWGEWVLFNTLPTCGIGDHWVVASMSEDANIATLAFSFSRGQAFYDHVLPFKLAMDLPFFAGVQVQPLIGSDGQPPSHYELCVREQQRGRDALRQVRMGGEMELYWTEGAEKYLEKGFQFLAPKV
jgi:hypothetical protein